MEEKDSELIILILNDVKRQQEELSKASNKHKEDTIIWQGETSSRLERIEVDLREHKEGVINNRSLLKTAEKRLELLERPKIVIGSIKDFALGSARVITALTILGGAILWLKNIL